MKYDICVIGLGYIGLPTAAMFASRKIRVVGVDINRHTVETINNGEIHIVEPDLDIVVRAVVTDFGRRMVEAYCQMESKASAAIAADLGKYA